MNVPSKPELRRRIKVLEDAIRQECAKFRFPDEDRPIIWAALKGNPIPEERIGEVAIKVRKWRLIRYAERHPMTEERLPAGTRLAWTGGGFVVEGDPENDGLVEEYNAFDDADRERLRVERKYGVLVAVVSEEDKA